MRWVIRGYALVLLAYTGWRTYDFMVNQLPAGDTSPWLAILFLFATEAGLALWHEISMNHSTTREQHGASVALTWVDFVGSLTAGVADMILRQTFYSGYEIPPALALALLYGLPAIVALNVAGVLFYLSNDSEIQLDRAKKELRFEVTQQALRELRNDQSQVAESMKKDIARRLKDDVTGRLTKEYLREPKPTTAARNPRRLVLPLMRRPSSNGHQVNYNAETEAGPELSSAKLEYTPAKQERRERPAK